MHAPRLIETNLRGMAGKLNKRKNWIKKFASAILSFWVQKGHLSFPRVGTLVSAITENGENGHSSPKTHPRAKLPITDPLKFGSPVFWVLTEMQNWCQPLQKMGKMAVAPQKHVLEQNFQLQTPLKFGSLVFWVSMEMQNWCRPWQKMRKIAVAPQKCILEQNFQLPTPPKVWVSPWKFPRAIFFILPHQSPMYSFTLPNIIIYFIFVVVCQ